MSGHNNVPNWHSSLSERTLYLANRQFPVAAQPIAHNEIYGGGRHRSGIHSSQLPTNEEGNLSPASSEASSYYKVDFSDLDRTKSTTQARAPRTRRPASNTNFRENNPRPHETIIIDSEPEDETILPDAPSEPPQDSTANGESHPQPQPQPQSRQTEVITLGSDSDFEATPLPPSDPQASVFKMSTLDIVQDPQLRSVLQAADRACEQCIAILDLIQANRDPKALSPTYEKDLSTQQKLLYSHLAVVRGLNRKALLNARKTKQETTDARQEVDKLHLQLQNLYYEQRHFRGEITVCKNYE